MFAFPELEEALDRCSGSGLQKGGFVLPNPQSEAIGVVSSASLYQHTTHDTTQDI